MSRIIFTGSRPRSHSLKVYSPPAENPEDDVNTIWIPLKKA